jgi:hypothetical protein
MKILCVLAFLVLGFAAPAPGAADWCLDGPHDIIYATVEDGTITVHHDASLYNCCPDSIIYDWTQEGARFTVVETEVNPMCMCMCCFNLTTSMENVPPGAYEIEFLWERLGHPHQQVFQVIVPDEGQAGLAEEGPATSSTCLHDAPSGVDSDEAVGSALALFPVRPNPVRDRAVVDFELASPARAVLAVYSSGGSRLRVVLDEELGAGRHSASWDCRDEQGRRLPQGVYFCELRAGEDTAVRRLLVLR